MNRRHFILLFMSVLIGVGIWSISQLNYDPDMSSIKLASDDEVKSYNERIAAFPVYKGGTIVILGNNKALNTYDSFLALDSITRFISELPEVTWTSSITNLDFPRKGPFGVSNDPFVNLETEEKFDQWNEEWVEFEDINTKFISQDKGFTLIFANSENGLSAQSITAIKNHADLVNPSFKIRVLQENLTQEAVQSDFVYESAFLALICILLILISFYLLARSFLSLFIISFTILFNISVTGILTYLLNVDFNLQMIALPCLLIIFSFTDVMHILHHQSFLKAKTNDTSSLQKELLKSLRTPILLTSLSNLFGFIIFLILSKNEHLTDLALISILGITVAYLTSRFLIIPLMTHKRTYISADRIAKVQNRVQHFVPSKQPTRRSALVLTIAVAIFLCYQLITNFKIDTQTGAVTQNEEIADAQLILSGHFYGSKSIEVVLEFSKAGAVWDIENLRKIEALEEKLALQFNSLYETSPVTIVKRYMRYKANGNPKAFHLPKVLSQNSKEEIAENYARLGGDQVVGPDEAIGRIIVGYYGLELYESREEYARIESILQDFETSTMKMSLGGIDYLADEGTYYFSKSLLLGWTVGIFLSGIILFFLLRSFKRALVFLMVNLLPLLLVLFIMPYFALEINPQSLFLLTILAGLCVDDSIFIMLHKNARQSPPFFPIIITSAVLASGFIAFGFSRFEWLSPFSWIFLIGIFAALVLDLFILPLFMPENKKEND